MSSPVSDLLRILGDVHSPRGARLDSARSVPGVQRWLDFPVAPRLFSRYSEHPPRRMTAVAAHHSKVVTVVPIETRASAPYDMFAVFVDR